MLEMIDTDGSGSVDLAEFLDWWGGGHEIEVA